MTESLTRRFLVEKDSDVEVTERLDRLVGEIVDDLPNGAKRLESLDEETAFLVAAKLVDYDEVERNDGLRQAVVRTINDGLSTTTEPTEAGNRARVLAELISGRVTAGTTWMTEKEFEPILQQGHRLTVLAGDAGITASAKLGNDSAAREIAKNRRISR